MIRAAALRSPWRSVCPRQSKAGWTIEITRFIHTEQLPPVLDSKPCPPDRDPSPPQKGFFVRMYERYSFQKEKERWIQAESFFQSLSHQAHDARWFGPGLVPRNFRSQHALLTLHFWLINKRLIYDTAEKEHAMMVQEELFVIFWEDTICRIRREGVYELAVQKHLQKIQKLTYRDLVQYDKCYAEFYDKPAERLQELRRLVWLHILGRDEAAEHRTDHLNRIAWYIEANYQNIMMHWPDQYYRQGRLAWVDLPDFSNMRDVNGKIMEEGALHPDDIIPHPWRRNITSRGQYYFWHPETRESVWTRPDAMNIGSS